MDKNMLEFWGQLFLTAARSQEQLEHMNKLLGKNVNENPFINSIYQALGIPKPQDVTADDFWELVKKSTDVYQNVIKSSLNYFEVVPKEDYLKLTRENDELKAKISELEALINSMKNHSTKKYSDQEQFVSSLTDIVKNQTEQFQQLMKQINLSYKKEKQNKKK